MTPRGATRAGVALALALASATAAGAQTMDHDGGTAHQVPVSIQYSAYAPARLDVLAGDTVVWTNDSSRRHTVTAEDDTFDSGPLVIGDTYRRRFDTTGAVPYYCRLHAGIVGEVDVHTVLMDPTPQPAAPGRAYPLRGRAAASAGSQITIEGDTGDGFVPVATVPVDDAGTFAATVTPATTTTYRAVAGGEASPARQVLVLDRSVAATQRRTTSRLLVTATVAPASAGATVVLQLRLPERFGWWPVGTARLGRDSRATFRVPLHRHVAARVVLTLADRATVLATSRTLPATR